MSKIRLVGLLLVVMLVGFGSVGLMETTEFDFRNSTWGMSVDEVAKSETAKFISGNFLLKYEDRVLGYLTTIYYSFDDVERLNSAMYSFKAEVQIESHPYHDEYSSIVASYTEKYGEPFPEEETVTDNESVSAVTHKTKWQTQTTDISVSLKYITSKEDGTVHAYLDADYNPREDLVDNSAI